MRTENVTLTANCDGLGLSLLVAQPETETEPLALLVIHHGMCEYKERYLWFMEQMTQAGFACVIADMRGHGASVKDPADRGYFYETGARGVLLDMHQILYYAKERFPELPTILMGHSMGSLVVRAYAKEHDFGLDALVVCGPPCKNAAVDVGLLLVKVIGALFGTRHRSRFLQSMAMGSYNKPFKKENRKNAWLSVNPENVEAYNESELCGFTFTVDGFRTLMELLRSVYQNDWECTKPKLPILVFAGADDPVIGGVKKFRHTVHFLRGQGYENVKGKLYAGNRHEILNDVSKEQAVKDLQLWLKRQMYRQKLGACGKEQIR